MAIAFITEEEANRAIRERLYIAGISVRVEKLYNIALTTQCQKCQGFGHLDNYYRKQAIYRLYTELYNTKQYSYNSCKSKGNYNHLYPKCVNCRGTH